MPRKKDEVALRMIMGEAAPWERWRAERLLTGQPGPLPPGWAMLQQPSGGWAPKYQPVFAEVGATVRMLLHLAWLGLGERPETGRTVAFVQAFQHADGRWSDRGAMSHGFVGRLWEILPFGRNKQGVDKLVLQDVIHTSLCAGALCLLGQGAFPPANHAAAWLKATRLPGGALPGHPMATAAMAAVLWHQGEAEEAERALAAVSRRPQDKPWDNSEYYMALALLLGCAVPASHPAVAGLLDSLERNRHANGLWLTTLPGEDYEVTVGALEVLVRAGRR